jgi:hypothetical protein
MRTNLKRNVPFRKGKKQKYAEEGKDQNIDFLSKLNLQLYFNEIVESSLKRMVQLSNEPISSI